MASSGSFGGNFVTISSPYGGYIFTNWQLASQDIAGNFSTINWQTYFHFGGCDAQLDNGRTDWNGGALWTSGRDHNYGGNFSTRDLGLQSGSFNIGHDGGGNATLNLSNGIDVFSSGHSGGSGSWGLPTIPRYANFTVYGVTNTNDQGFTVQIAADNYCSNIEYSINGGGSWTSLGAGSALNAILNNLPSNTNYTVYARLTRADSGLQTTSGPISVTTLAQNNFLALL